MKMTITDGIGCLNTLWFPFSSMKTPDAIQVASAIEGKADFFITNDKGIKTPRALEKIVLKDYL